MSDSLFAEAEIFILMTQACDLSGSGRKENDMPAVAGLELKMPRVCAITGRRTSAGRSISRRGKAKRLGGVGKKITGRVKRKFKANIQRVRAVVDGKVVRINVSAKAIRGGLVEKPVKRTWKPETEE